MKTTTTTTAAATTTTAAAAARPATVSPSEGSTTSNSRYSKRSKGARRFRLDRGRRSSAPSISLSGGDLSSLLSEDDEKVQLSSSGRDQDDTNEIFVYTGTGTTGGAGVHVHVDDEQQRLEEKATKTKTDPTGGESFLDAKEKPPRLMTDSMRELLQIDDGEKKTAPVSAALKTTTSTTTQSSKPLLSAMKPTNHNNYNNNNSNNGEEDYTAHVCFGGGEAVSYRSAASSATRGRDASPPPPSVSERSTSPSLPRKIRQVQNQPQVQHHVNNTLHHQHNPNNNVGGFHYKRRVSASTPNLAAMASSADLLNDTIHDVVADNADTNGLTPTRQAATRKIPQLPLVDNNLMNNLSIFIPLSSGEPVSTVSKMKRSKSELILLSPEFGTRLMRVNEQRDPLFYYEVKKTLGKGSMGSVALVQKRSQTVGGSARKLVVDSIQKHKRKQECFRLPFGIGRCFRLCINDKLQMMATTTDEEDDGHESDDDSGVSESSRGRGRGKHKHKSYKGRGGNGRNNSSTNAVIDPPPNYKEEEEEDTNWWTSSTSICSSADSSTFAISSRRKVSNSSNRALPLPLPPTEIIPDGYHEQENDYEDDLEDVTESEMHTPQQQRRKQLNHQPPRDYNYAMKSIHLSRVNDNSFVQELENEIEQYLCNCFSPM